MSAEHGTRWSSARYTNVEVPNYIPSEALVLENGQFLRALLLRVLAQDMQRMLATDSAEQYFINIPIEPTYDAQGNRENTPTNLLSEKRLHVIDEIGNLLRMYIERADNIRAKEITRKIYFTPEHMSTGAWGSILGARGAVHQRLEKDYKCKIVLAGRGITNPLKDTSPHAASLAMEDPHARVSAANEQDLQLAVERIEWILSDDPEAEEFREKNRRHTAQIEGRYDPRTWVSAADRRAANETKAGGDAKPGEKREREEEEKVDEELDDFLQDL